MWENIVDGRLIGPYLLPPCLTGNTYRLLLQEVLGELSEDVSLDIRRRLRFYHDSASPHFADAAPDHLNRFSGRDR